MDDLMTTFRVGQRVQARFNPGNPMRLGVVTSESSLTDTIYVQFSPCDGHWGCQPSNVNSFGDANGWTDQEYRVEREKAYCWERAKNVEDERRERYPDSPFSAYRGE